MINNIGRNFENWFINNYNTAMANKEVKNFTFVERNMNTIPQEEKGDYYQKSVTNIAKSRIENYDLNQNGKMEFVEYLKEQVSIYEKMFKEQIDLSVAGMREILKTTFDNCDLNKDGSIDEQEMSAVFAYMDANSSEGKLDGNISYKSAFGTDWTQPQIPHVLQQLKDFIFQK